MREKNKIDRAHKIDKTARRAGVFDRTRTQRVKEIFHCKRACNLDARIVIAKRVQLVRVRRGDQRFSKLQRNFFSASVWIE